MLRSFLKVSLFQLTDTLYFYEDTDNVPEQSLKQVAHK